MSPSGRRQSLSFTVGRVSDVFSTGRPVPHFQTTDSSMVKGSVSLPRRVHVLCSPASRVHGSPSVSCLLHMNENALTASQGVPSRFLYFPDENHWVLKASNSRKWHVSLSVAVMTTLADGQYEVFRWLAEWTGVKGEGMVEEERPSLVLQHA